MPHTLLYSFRGKVFDLFYHQCFLVPQEAEQKVASELEDLGKTAAEYKECFEQLTKGLCCLYLALVTHLMIDVLF